MLETRIHLENPALLTSWLLRARDPILPKVITAVRGVVLKKLREEADSAKTRGSKSKKKAAEKVVVRGGILHAPVPVSPAMKYNNYSNCNQKMILKFRSF